MTIKFGDGKGAFPSQMDVAAPGIGGEPASVAGADINGDGRIDLLIGSQGKGGLAVARGLGNGTFGPPSYTTFGDLISFIEPADLDGNGRMDLVVGSYRQGAIDVLLSRPDGTFDAPLFFGVGAMYGPFRAAIGDFNGDRLPDVAVGGYDYPNVPILIGGCR